MARNPEKSPDFPDEMTLQAIDLARYLFNRTIPSGWIAR